MTHLVLSPVAEDAVLSPPSPSPSSKSSVVAKDERLREHDVLLGRGTGPNTFAGNIRFRKLVRDVMVKACGFDVENTSSHTRSSNTGADNSRYDHAVDSIATSAMDKSKIAQRIADVIQARNGRFLRPLTQHQFRDSSMDTSTTSDTGKKVVVVKATSTRPPTCGIGSCSTPSHQIYEEVDNRIALQKIKQTLRHQLRTFKQEAQQDQQHQRIKLLHQQRQAKEATRQPCSSTMAMIMRSQQKKSPSIAFGGITAPLFSTMAPHEGRAFPTPTGNENKVSRSCLLSKLASSSPELFLWQQHHDQQPAILLDRLHKEQHIHIMAQGLLSSLHSTTGAGGAAAATTRGQSVILASPPRLQYTPFETNTTTTPWTSKIQQQQYGCLANIGCGRNTLSRTSASGVATGNHMDLTAVLGGDGGLHLTLPPILSTTRGNCFQPPL